MTPHEVQPSLLPFSGLIFWVCSYTHVCPEKGRKVFHYDRSISRWIKMMNLCAQQTPYFCFHFVLLPHSIASEVRHLDRYSSRYACLYSSPPSPVLTSLKKSECIEEEMKPGLPFFRFLGSVMNSTSLPARPPHHCLTHISLLPHNHINTPHTSPARQGAQVLPGREHRHSPAYFLFLHSASNHPTIQSIDKHKKQ